MLQEAVSALLDEILLGPADPSQTWVVSNRPGSGVVGTLRALSAAEARRSGPGGTSAAHHAAHLRFALDLAYRAFRGENSYAGADWAGSWRLGAIDAKTWSALLGDLERQGRLLLDAIRAGVAWEDPVIATGSIALVAHSAYHLGAIRQLAMLPPA
jgi:hypothetical protein